MLYNTASDCVNERVDFWAFCVSKVTEYKESQFARSAAVQNYGGPGRKHYSNMEADVT